MDLSGVSDVVWRKCLQAKPGEKALVIADPHGERREIGEALVSAGRKYCKCDLATMAPTGLSGREPPPEIAKKMLKYDIVLAPLEYSITHTKAMKVFGENGGRAATMPGITKDIFLRAITVDYEAVTQTNAALKKALENGRELRLATKAGTDIIMQIAPNRKVSNCNGILKPGKVTNLPDGEVAIAPKEGSSNGVIVFDLSSMGDDGKSAKLKKPFKAYVKNGLLMKCENRRLWETLSSVDNGTNLAELGIGTNPQARIIGQILEDEKVLGTAHIAFGTSAELGGLVQTSVHADSVLDKPTISVDGRVIMKEGKILR
jgi:leucyl aminopeptidase (aminopeptidase T)